jgi:hypothetical protein
LALAAVLELELEPEPEPVLEHTLLMLVARKPLRKEAWPLLISD